MSEITVAIRPAEKDDLQSLTDLAIQSFRVTYEAHNDPDVFEAYLRSSLTVENLRRELTDADNVFLVAHESSSGNILGYAKLRQSDPGPGVEDQNAIEIERIYADPARIGQGIGAALMQACLDASLQLGHQTIWLGVWKPNERAIGFYEKWGFKIVGEYFFRMGSEKQEDFVMSRTIRQ